MSIYEVHLGSWRRDPARPQEPLGYRELADELADYVADMGFTHVELLPVMHHPYTGSWGYQVTGFYAPMAKWGDPDDLRYLIERMHERGIGVILDWVPAHFAKDEWALARFDGTALFEHDDPRRGEHPDWGTYVFNFGRNEVRNFLLGSALYWLREYHADGLRVDGVASMLYLDYSRSEGEWVPNVHGGREDLDAISFLQELNQVAHREPGVVSAAEESTAWPGVSRPTYLGGLGFGLKWNMGWMHDTLGYFARDPIHRQFHHHELTFSLVYAWNENFVLPLSHDEVVHGKGSLLQKMPGDRWRQLANLRALYAYMWAHPGKQLLFMGGEIAQESEWSDERSLDWHLLERAEHSGVQSLVRDLNRVYRAEPALWEVDFEPAGFRWLEPNDAAGNVYAFARLSADGSRQVVCLLNLAPVPRRGYRVGMPADGTLGRGAQHGRRGLRRLGRREPGRRASPSRCPGTTSRSRPRSRCRRSARSGSRPKLPRRCGSTEKGGSRRPSPCRRAERFYRATRRRRWLTRAKAPSAISRAVRSAALMPMTDVARPVEPVVGDRGEVTTGGSTFAPTSVSTPEVLSV